MAKKIRALSADARWKTFAEHCAMDAARCTVEVCGMTSITWQQMDLFNSVSQFGSRTSVSSAHGTGETRAFAVIARWHLSATRTAFQDEAEANRQLPLL